MKNKKFEDGTLCHVNFGNRPLNGEIYNYHLAVLFNISGLKNTIFCVPLTSPKLKHFETTDDYNNKDYRNMKYFRYHYIKQTDSIALLEQIRVISIDRLVHFYKDADNKVIVLNDKEMNLLKNKVTKYVDRILNKKESSKIKKGKRYYPNWCLVSSFFILNNSF